MEYVNSSKAPNIYSREEIEKVKAAGYKVIMDGRNRARVFLSANRVEFIKIKEKIGKVTSIVLKKKEMETLDNYINGDKFKLPNRVHFSSRQCGAVRRTQIVGPEILIRGLLKRAGLR